MWKIDAQFALPQVLSAGSEEELERLQQCEAAARKSHVGMWVYGDPGGEDDDDDAAPARKPAWGGAGILKR